MVLVPPPSLAPPRCSAYAPIIGPAPVAGHAHSPGAPPAASSAQTARWSPRVCSRRPAQRRDPRSLTPGPAALEDPPPGTSLLLLLPGLAVRGAPCCPPRPIPMLRGAFPPGRTACFCCWCSLRFKRAPLARGERVGAGPFRWGHSVETPASLTACARREPAGG